MQASRFVWLVRLYDLTVARSGYKGLPKQYESEHSTIANVIFVYTFAVMTSSERRDSNVEQSKSLELG